MLSRQIIQLGFFTMCTILFFSSCKKEHLDEIPYTGNVNALINGVLWEGDAHMLDRGSTFHLGGDKYKDIGNGIVVPWEHLGMAYINKSVGNRQKIIPEDSLYFTIPPQTIHAYGAFGTSQDDGDVACDLYQVLGNDSVNNWVRVIRQENNYSEVWGSFSMHLYRIYTCNVSTYPDTLLITNGSFYFKIK